jgi:hypothetical protein
MFDFKSAENVIVDFPTKLYWSVAGSITVLLLIGQLFLTFPEWTARTIEIIGWNWLKNSRLYNEATKRKGEKDKQAKEKNSVVRRGTNESEGKAQSTEGRGLSKSPANEMNRPRQENGVEQNGQSTTLWPLLGRRNRPNPKGNSQV